MADTISLVGSKEKAMGMKAKGKKKTGETIKEGLENEKKESGARGFHTTGVTVDEKNRSESPCMCQRKGDKCGGRYAENRGGTHWNPKTIQ